MRFYIKTKNPQGLEEYRFICLVGCIYKILPKLLASRLNKVLCSITSKNNIVFNARRNMFDGVVIEN